MKKYTVKENKSGDIYIVDENKSSSVLSSDTLEMLKIKGVRVIDRRKK